MARPLRIVYPGAFYHITARGNERKDIFKSKNDRTKFLAYLETAWERYDARIHAYCLMDNHYHLLLETPSGNLPQIMRHINGAYTTYFNLKRNRSGHLLQGRYMAILVAADEYAKELSRYIHLNPVRAKAVEIPEEYEWSSFRNYIGKERKPEWLYSSFILGYFGNKASTAQKKYREFVTMLNDQEYKSPLCEVVSSTILGSADFVAFTNERYLEDKKPDKNVPALKELSRKASVEEIVEAVEHECGEDQKLARNIKLYLCQRYSGRRLKEIGAHFGIGESGVSQASRRVVERIGSDKKLARRIKRIKENLNLSKMKT